MKKVPFIWLAKQKGTEHEREVGLYSNSIVGKLEVVTLRKCGDG